MSSTSKYTPEELAVKRQKYREYYAKKREEILERQRAAYHADESKRQEKILAKREYRKEHAAELTKNRKERYEKDRESGAWREYYEKNKQKYIERSRKWREENKEKASATAKAYRERKKAEKNASA